MQSAEDVMDRRRQFETEVSGIPIRLEWGKRNPNRIIGIGIGIGMVDIGIGIGKISRYIK